MGQSLGSGEDAFPVVTIADTGDGNFQFARGVHTWRAQAPTFCRTPELRPDAEFALVPLVGGEPATSTGETIASGLADSLKNAVGRQADIHYLVSFAGRGNTRLHDLDKRHDNTTDPRSLEPTPGGFYRTSIDDVRRAKAQADARGWRYSVGAITWMQGEKNDDLRLDDWSEPLEFPAFVDAYADDLIALKNDWNDDILPITQQSQRIRLFTYQTLGAIAGQAQLAAADKDPEIHLVSPIYYLMSAINSRNPYTKDWGAVNHLTGDSERWLGAQFAKVMKRVLIDSARWEPLRPLTAWTSVDRTTVYVRYSVPVPPLVIDTQFLPAHPTRGFHIPGGPKISGASTIAADTIALTLAGPLAPGAHSIEYVTENVPTVTRELHAGALDVRTGTSAAGHSTNRVVIAGDLREEIQPILQHGVFYLETLDAMDFTRGIIRKVFIDEHGNTVFEGEEREIVHGASFRTGQALAVAMIMPYGNIRDSDAEPSQYTFVHGPRVGQPYPLWNWSVAFRGLPIQDAPPAS
jgi:hypothetical protein